jgi:hypothetical protein
MFARVELQISAAPCAYIPLPSSSFSSFPGVGMEIRNRIWLGLGVVIAASTACYAGTGGLSGLTGMDHDAMEAAGEGGESGGVAGADMDDTAYLAQLAFIRGHLNVGVNLYREGELEGSATHMKHPGDELYTNLLPAMEARHATGFAEQLEALALAVTEQRSLAEVETAYAALQDAITQAENAVTELKAEILGAVILNLVRTAAAEYDIAVGEGGVLENEHEYQDALGFVRVAVQLLEPLDTLTDNKASVAAIRAQLDLIMPIWSGLKAPARLDTPPSVIYGAAGRIEIATLSL